MATKDSVQHLLQRRLASAGFAALTCVAFLSSSASAQDAKKQSAAAFDTAVNRGEYARAAEIVHAQVARLGPNPDVRRPEVRTALLDATRIATLAARWEDAGRRLELLEARMRRAFPAEDAAFVPVLRRRGMLAAELYEFADADRYFSKARRITAVARVDDAEVAALLQASADSLGAQHRWWEATQARNDELRFLERTQGPESFAVGIALVALAQLLDEPYPYRFALRKSALERAEKILGTAYRDRRPDRISSLAAIVSWVFESAGMHDYRRWDECKLRKEWMGVTKHQFGPGNILMIEPLVDYASYCETELEGPEIESLFDRALVIAHSTWGARHPSVLYVLEHQGRYYTSREGFSSKVGTQNARGRRILTEMTNAKARVYPSGGSLLAVHKLDDVIAVGSFECNPFGPPTCVSPLRDAIATLERNWGTAHPALTELRADLARALAVRGANDHSESATQSRRRFIAEQFHLALDAATARHGPHHPQTARIAGAYAEYLGNDNQQYDEAAKLQESVVQTYRRHFGSDDSATLEAEKTLGRWEEASPRGAAVSTGADEQPSTAAQ